jgi:hypothetical protein
MHIISAIAFRRVALRRAKAIITHMGFHAMLSRGWPEGCAAQVVNPLNAFSLGCRSGAPLSQPGPHPRRWPGGRCRGAVAVRLPDDLCRTQRGHAAAERSRPAGRVTSGSCAPPASRAWPASMAGAIARFCPIRPICTVRPNAAPHTPRRAVITDPFRCGQLRRNASVQRTFLITAFGE